MSDDPYRDLYRERAHLVAHLAAEYPSTIGHTDPAEPGWAVVTITLPTSGQATWHISPEDMDLFEHVSTAEGVPWDGHDTPTKYERLRAETRARAKWRAGQ